MPVTSNIQPFAEYFTKKIMTRSDASWARHNRVEAYARFKAHGLPTRALEAWHYTSLKELESLSFDAVITSGLASFASKLASPVPRRGLPGVAGHEVASSLPPPIAALIPADAIRLVFVGGAFAATLSTPPPYPPGLTLALLGELSRDEKAPADALFVNGDLPKASSLIHLNSACATDGLQLDIADNTEITAPIFIVQLYSGDTASPDNDGTNTRVPISMLRHSIRLGANAQLTLCELHHGLDDKPVVANTFTRVKIGRSAKLVYARVATESAEARSIAVTWGELARSAQWEATDFGFGARLCRRETRARLLGEGASVILKGLGAVKAGRHWDTHVSVEHLSPSALSRQVYKNIVSDGARAIFNGKVLVAKDAQRTNASQLNRNLLLGRGAEADTKPELEILADDVKVSHGATVGHPNPEELFYLMSRAIPAEDAMGMLLRGFAGEITATAPAGLARGLNRLMEEEFFA